MAGAATAGALAFTVAVTPDAGAPVYLPFAAAVAVSAWYGGLGPGLAASVLSVLAIDFSFLAPIGRLELTHAEELFDIAIFVAVALIISTTTSALRRARGEALARSLALARAIEAAEERMREVEALSDGLRESNRYLTEARASAERAASVVRSMLDVTAALSESRTVDEVARVVMERGLPAVGAARGFLARIEDSRIVVLASRGYEPGRQPLTVQPPADRGSPLRDALRSPGAGPEWLSTPDEFERRYPHLFARVGAVSERQVHVVLPLSHTGELVGGLALSFADPSDVGAADRDVTMLFGQIVAAALHRAIGHDAELARGREAEMRARAREEILGIVAHDLRNPLHLVSMSVGTLGESVLEAEDRARLVTVAERAVKRMNRLIADLLDSARLESGRMSLLPHDVSLETIVRHAEEANRPIAVERQIELVARCETPDAMVHVDVDRMQQALGNLLDNALKFTPSGGRVTLDGRADDRQAVLSVTDTGPGIAPDRLVHVFEPFWQERKGDPRGAGLGLSIAKGIVEAHGGRISAESTPGKGTTFSIFLPM